MGSAENCTKVIDACKQQGVLSDWFLFAADKLRIAPPLIITEKDLNMALSIIIDSHQKLK